jgi:hypothetical protein
MEHHVFLSEDSRANPIVIMQVTANDGGRSNIYVGESDGVHQLAELFCSVHKLPSQLIPRVAAQIANKKNEAIENRLNATSPPVQSPPVIQQQQQPDRALSPPAIQFSAQATPPQSPQPSKSTSFSVPQQQQQQQQEKVSPAQEQQQVPPSQSSQFQFPEQSSLFRQQRQYVQEQDHPYQQQQQQVPPLPLAPDNNSHQRSSAEGRIADDRRSVASKQQSASPETNRQSNSQSARSDSSDKRGRSPNNNNQQSQSAGANRPRAQSADSTFRRKKPAPLDTTLDVQSLAGSVSSGSKKSVYERMYSYANLHQAKREKLAVNVEQERANNVQQTTFKYVQLY